MSVSFSAADGLHYAFGKTNNFPPCTYHRYKNIVLFFAMSLIIIPIVSIHNTIKHDNDFSKLFVNNVLQFVLQM